ncbi:patatin-like phospholipase family protein [Geodermatophilus sp. SYSU D00696]
MTGQQRCDLVLEGGGVKGIGLVGALSVLEEAGYRVQRVAGTSAGAIVGSLVAAGTPAARLAEIMAGLDWRRFQDRSLVDRIPILGQALSLAFDKGLYEGRYLRDWLVDRLAERGVTTFSDLAITPEQDPGSALPPEKRYRLTVVVSDVTCGLMRTLPADYDRYGLVADDVPVADAARASASIPFFFEPVTLDDVRERRKVVLVDGGMLSNFPVGVFDRRDGRPPRWPTFGIKLSARGPATPPGFAVRGPASLSLALLKTLIGHTDRAHLNDPDVVERTIFVDTDGVSATDFDLDRATADRLYENGRTAARQFLDTWDWDAYLARRTTRLGAEPRIPQQAPAPDTLEAAPGT